MIPPEMPPEPASAPVPVACVPPGPMLCRAQVMHRRRVPADNAFRYPAQYVLVPLSRLAEADAAGGGWLGVESEPAPASAQRKRWAPASVRLRDHGHRDGTHPVHWVRERLAHGGVTAADGEVWLMTHPRVLGYLFNPVTFWFCTDRAGQVRALLAAVSNTFGEHHDYLICHPDQRPIQPDDWLDAPKEFHVSPFFTVEGRYRFRLALTAGRVGVWIDYQRAESRESGLRTAVAGPLEPLTPTAMARALLRAPWMTLRITVLIHWQALRLWCKGVRYVPKPPPPADAVTLAASLSVSPAVPPAVVSRS